MSPKTQNWQRHIRGLVDTIVLRDSDHAYSTNNYRLLAASRLFIVGHHTTSSINAHTDSAPRHLLL